MAQAIAERTGALTSVPATHLSVWLPGLVVPPGWYATTAVGATAARMLTRSLSVGQNWDACEVLNLYRVPGTVPETVVLLNADRTLRDSGAHDIDTRRIDIPASYGVIATRARGTLYVGTRGVRVHYNHFAVNATAGAALVEQVVLVVAEVYPVLGDEVEELASTLHGTLLASIDSAVASYAGREVECPASAPVPVRSGLDVAEQGEL